MTRSKYLIKNISIVDGTGRARYTSDIEFSHDQIINVDSNIISEDAEIIDGRGLTVAPGFIDVHTHDDTNVIRYPDCVPKISQGVTTVIVGNCGISASPAVLLDSPPDPMNLLGQKEDFQYPRFKDYADAIEKAQPAVNVAALVGHTTLRNNVMDDLYRTATRDEIELMKEALSDSLKHGALGLSSGLAYASAFESDPEEVTQLAAELTKQNGIYTTHMRSEFEPILDAMKEAFYVGKANDIPVVISHLKCAGAGNWGRTVETLALMDKTKKHQDVSCDCYPYSASSSTLDLKQVTDEFDIFITWSQSRPEHAQKMLKSIASEMGCTLLEAAKALQPAGAVYHNMHPEDVERVLSSEHSMIGSDGLPNDPHPHPRLWGTFPRMLGHYCREKNLLSLEQAVHKMTGKSAHRFNLVNRGVIKKGAFADLVIFDAETIKDEATFSQPEQKAKGIHSVYVNGQLAYQNNTVEHGRYGRFLRRGC
ncbi:D-aminoacylase [Vibrio sp. MACH09]|uniref:N-acyl-D-amino-acid deacylase family protein n=1 Tax=Vibrio sp. MACH09 TaxID=3025122 RepID=UPI00279275BD|nr:D-aminoacylase [Vibrio sp. MACH09]GLO63987.1 D-aminoacylase [Vibrio sp. MACH09]